VLIPFFFGLVVGVGGGVVPAGGRGGGVGAALFPPPRDHTGPGPGIYHIHGGGMIVGDRLLGVVQTLPWIVEHDAVLVTVEYRLAPEFPDPYPVEDCYAGLVWTAEHAADLGIDPERIVVAGASAGGGLAAGTALLARDRRGPALLGQVLICPMLDDRGRTTSTYQYADAGTWNGDDNRVGWTALLGARRGTEDVSVYAAPARATDLAGLPPAFIDCGSAELFRDEDVAYATALWAAGVPAELHVWAGGFHGFDLLAPHTAVSRAATAARDDWVARLLGS
ncbi:alpha/beta hydrolase, partial [Streptomyces roseolus]|uniref:alpha/beta hydrolase n=1 Tax=Streptomyces roseolus TaxID=67358 RepID=UPI00365AB962